MNRKETEVKEGEVCNGKGWCWSRWREEEEEGKALEGKMM